MRGTVFVGLSGGVDSSVSAALLRNAGYDITGVFIKIWQPEFLECTWREDRVEAMRAAAVLGIPFLEVDLSASYKREVIDVMLADYTSGITPNPDMLCNRHVKFGEFIRWARSHGAEMIATGHYARTVLAVGGAELMRGIDGAKDQSYFLSGMERDALGAVLFPIGDMTKREVRALAERYELPAAKRPDSQGLCFVGEVTMADFLRRYIPVKRGDVLDLRGTRIGEHDGAALYTVGQRHGFSVTDTDAALRTQYYVVRVDARSNTLVVSAERSDAAVREVALTDLRWLIDEPRVPCTVHGQTRYRDLAAPIELRKAGETYIARFETPRIVASGQTLAFYDGERCLGSATMRRSE